MVHQRAELGRQVSSIRKIQIEPGNRCARDRALDIADVVRSVAQEIGVTASQVALAWTLSNPAVTAPVMGARTLAQAEDNLGALDVALSDEQRARLDTASAREPVFPARFVGRPRVQQLIFGGSNVTRR